MVLHLAEQGVQGLNVACAQGREGVHDPCRVRLRHGVELLAALGGQPHQVGAPVALDLGALDQTFGLQLVGDAGDIAARHHHAARQLVHAHALGLALELRHQVEARQRGAPLLAQIGAHLLFNQLRAGEQAQPQAQLIGVFGVGAGFQIHRVTPCWPPRSLPNQKLLALN